MLDLVAAAEAVRGASSKPNTVERGSAIGTGLGGIVSWGQLSGSVGASIENVPELLFPNSPYTYSKMRSDSQINGLARGTMLPISRYRWFIRPNGAADEVVEKQADDLGLPIEGEGPEDRPQRRSKNRFNFGEHLRLGLLALLYGFYFFEQVFEYRDSTGQYHLKKLGERPPWSISEINVAKDGGLENIRQSTDINEKPIPVDHLLCYTWDKEGGNWLGRSLLRGCYGPWTLKDRVIRVGSVNIERNGAGTPIIEAPPGASKEEIEWLDALARKFRAGHSAGGAIPAGTKLTLKGVEGTQPDSVGFLKFLNEEMSRSFLMMFFQLGQTESGSRALGGEFIDWFGISQESIADWFKGIFNEHQIEDDIDLNYGEDEPAPLLDYEVDPDEAPQDGLAEEVDQGKVQVDEEVEEELNAAATNRTKSSRRKRAASGRNGGRARRAVSGSAGAASPLSLPARPLRRQPYDHEVQASTDFAAIDSSYESALDLMMIEARMLINLQLDDLHDQIVAAGGDLDDLSEIAATPIMSGPLYARLEQVANLSAQLATDEASRQGVAMERPSLEGLTDELNARAEAVDAIVARDVSAAASRRAVRLTGGSLNAAEVADGVREALQGLAWAGIRDELGGAINSAQNAGRALVFKRDDQAGRIYASALLDPNTCSACVQIDGTQYASMTEAARDFPTGGYKDCHGGPRDRCTLVKVYEEVV